MSFSEEEYLKLRKKRLAEQGQGAVTATPTVSTVTGGTKDTGTFSTEKYLQLRQTRIREAELGEIYQGYTAKAGKLGLEKFDSDKQAEVESQGNKSFLQQLLETNAKAFSTANDNPVVSAVNRVAQQYREDTTYREPREDWSEEQKSIFGYLYGKDTGSAYAYAEKVNNELDTAKVKAQKDQVMQDANAGHAVLGRVTHLTGMADALDKVAEFMGRGTVTVRDTLSPYEYGKAGDAGITQKLNESGGTINEAIPVIGGKGWGDVYGIGTSVIDSAINRFGLGKVGTTINSFSGVASSVMNEDLAKGASTGQAALHGLVSGLAEAGTEYLEVDRLIKLKSAKGLKGFFKNILQTAIPEGVEEGITAVVDAFADQLIMKDKSGFSESVAAYQTQGLSEADAKKQAWMDTVNEVFYSVLAGGVAGGISGGIETAVKNVAQNKADEEYGNQYYRGSAQELIQQGLESAEGTESNTLAKKLQEKLSKGKAVTGQELTALVRANEQAIKAEDDEKIRTAVRERLVQLGNAKGADATAEVILKQLKGGKLTLKEQGILRNQPFGQRVANEVDPENVRSGGYASEWAEKIGTDRMHAQAYNRGITPERGDTAQPAVQKNAQGTVTGPQSNVAVSQESVPEPERISVAEQIRQQDENVNGGNINGNTYGGSERLTAARTAEGTAAATGTGISDGGSQRKIGLGTGEQVGRLAGGAGGTAVRQTSKTNRGKTIVDRQNRAGLLRQQGLSQQSSASLGISTGTEVQNLTVLPEDSWDDELQAVAQRVKEETGRDAIFVVGRIQVKTKTGTTNVRGVRTPDGSFIIQADNTSATATQIGDHELYHDKAITTAGLNWHVRQAVLSRFSEEEFQTVVAGYLDDMEGMLDVRDGDEFEKLVRRVEEEVLADAYAGINFFGYGADRFGDVVRETVDQQPGKGQRQDNGVRQTNGPNAGQNENTAEDGGVRYSAEDAYDYNKPITEQDIAVLRSIGRKSVSAFDSADLEKAQKWAYKFNQEMGVKSPFFRAWFGEWRAYDTKKVRVATIPQYVDSNDARKADRGEAKNEDTGWTITVSREGQTNTIAHAGANRLSERGLSGIKELIRNAVLLDTEVHEHHSNNTKNDLIAFDHRLYALGQSENGMIALYRITVEDYFQSKKQPSNKRFHNLKYIEKIADITSGRTFGKNRSGGSTYGISAIDYTVADLVGFVKQYDADYNVGGDASAIRNSDGTPKVMYHGTNADWSIYDLGKNINQMWGNGIYLAETEERARLYGDKVLPLFVKAKYNNREAKRLGVQRDYVQMKNGDVLVFSPSQIKSAADNIGTFDGSNPDIRYSMDDSEYDRLEAELAAKEPYWRTSWVKDQLGEEGYKEYQAKRAQREAQQKAGRKLQDKVNRQVKTNQRRLQQEYRDSEVDAAMRKKLAEGTKPTEAKQELRRSLLDMFSIPAGSRAETVEIINGYADRLLKNGELTEADRKAFFDRMYAAGVMTMPAETYMAEGRNAVKGGRVYVSDSVRADFGDDWNDIRRRAFGTGIYLTSDRSAGGIDVWNHELAQILPGLFDSEETDQRSILERIVQVAEEGADKQVSLAEYTARLAGENYVSEDEVMDHMERDMDTALRVFAKTAGIEIKLKERAIKQQAALTKENYRQRIQQAQERQERKEQAQRQRAQQELRELQNKTLKTLQWLSKNRHRAPEELREAWDEVLGDIDIYAVGAANEMRWSDKYGATWKDIAKVYKAAKETDPNFMPSKELEMIVSRLDDEKIADMDIGALNDLYKAAVGLRTEFYNRNNVISDELHRLFEEVYADAKKELEGAPGGYTGKGADKLFNLDQLTPMNVMQRMGGWDPDGTFYSMAKQLERGERDIRAFKVKANRMLEEFLTEHDDWVKKADGQGKDAIWYTIEVPELLQLGMGDKPIFGDTVTVHMTPAQKVHMYLESKNLDNLRHMTGGRTFADKELYSQGKRQEALAQGKTIRLAPETVKQIVSDLTPEELELAQILDKFYNDFAKQEINRVSNVLYGYDKAMGKNYAPIYTNKNYTKAEFGVFDQTAEGVGNLKGRQYAKNPSYNISAFDAFERNVDQTARFVGMAIPARNWTTLMNWREQNNSMGDVITHEWGEESKKYITDLITTLQAGEDFKTDTISSTLGKLQSNYITAVFGANAGIVMKQLGSIPMAGAYLDMKNAPTPRQIAGIDRNLIAKYTQDLAWRTMGYSMPETKQLKDNPNWTQTNKFNRFVFGGGAITAMDGWAASTLWPWAENKVRREHPELEIGTQAQVEAGESPFYKKVAEEFENALARSQSTSDEIHQSRLRKSKNPVTKAFTMFRSDSAQTYNVIRQKIGEAQYYLRSGADKEVIKTAKKAAGAAFCALLLNAAWSEVVSFLMALWKNKGKNYRDEEEELTFQSVAGEMASNMLGSIAGTVTWGEELYEVVGNVLTGKKIYDIEAPGIEQLNDVVNAISTAGGGMRNIIAGAVDVLKNGGDLQAYFSSCGNDLLGCVKEIAETAATYLTGASVTNVEAYLLGALRWISPELGTAYDDLLATADKSDMSDLEGDALEERLGHVLGNRGIQAEESTVKTLAELYAEGYRNAVPSDIPSSVTVNGEARKLGNYQQQIYSKTWNGYAGDVLDEVIASDEFREADPQKQEKMLKTLFDYASDQAKHELFVELEPSSRADDIAAFADVGLGMPEFLRCYAEYTAINSENIKASQKATKFSRWVREQGFTEDQDQTITEYLVYFGMNPADAGKFEGLVDSGLDIDDAYELQENIGELEPEEGAVQVSDAQKWRLCVDMSVNPAVQIAALANYMSDKQLKKAQVACNFDVDLSDYVKLYEIRAKYDADGNQSYSQTEYKAAIDSLHLDAEQNAILWQLVTGAKSAKNNPYDAKAGQKVLDMINDTGDEEEESLSFSEEIMLQLMAKG